MTIFGLILPTILGFAISLLITPHLTISERLAVGYGLGFGLLTLGMLFLNVLGIGFSLINTTIPLLGISIASLLFYLYQKKFLWNPGTGKFHFFRGLKQTIESLYLFEKIMIVLLVFFLVSNIIFATYWPVVWSDGLRSYDFRGKLLAQTLSFAKVAALELKEQDYVLLYQPPMTSLVHAWLYLCGWVNPKVFYPLLLICLAVVFYRSLRSYGLSYYCLLFTLLLVTTPIIYSYSQHAYLNFPFTFYFATGTFYFYRWILSQKRGFLTLAGLFLGLSSWVRRESLPFFLGYLAILIYFSVSRGRFFAPILFCLLYFSIEPLWRIYATNVLHLQPSSTQTILLSKGVMSQLSSTWIIGKRFFDFIQWQKVMVFLWNCIFVRFWIIFCFLILVTLLYGAKVREHRFLFLMIVSDTGLFIIGTYRFLLEYASGWYHLAGSAQRLFMMSLPILWYFIALITAEHDLSFLTLKISPPGMHRSGKEKPG